MVSHLFENGLVWIPTQPPSCEYLTDDSQLFLEAAVNFPNSDYNDIIDSMSQAFIHLTSNGWVVNKEDPRDDPEPDWKRDEKPFY